MDFVFYDLETTGLSPAFDQPLQFAAIYTDENFVEKDRVNIRCRLAPHILPSPQALVVTRVTPDQLTDPSLPSLFEFSQQVAELTERWAPAIWVGYNTIKFDEEVLRIAMESRKRVKDQLTRIDSTYPEVDFHYTGSDGQKRSITTVEEEEFPQFYHLKPALDPKEQGQEAAGADTDGGEDDAAVVDMETPSGPSAGVYTPPEKPALQDGHKVFTENRKGVSYDTLFGPYIDGATRIIVTDPYIRYFYQTRNMMEFVEMVIRRKAPEDQVAVHLVTGPDDGNVAQQRELLESISTACLGSGVDFTWAFDTSGTGHARDIVTDTGWKIVLDRGLDIFQAPVKTDGFSLSDRLQEHRMLKGFYVTYIRVEDAESQAS